ncbi:MAG TPA: glycosyltransferase family 4 protein [Thermomicrobiales bacterium]|nr:glycosyltransferase family 4 protein [Thermomicrobiales bacterium]
MKIALVSPYNFHHPGGVSEHIAHLREEFLRLGHQVIVIAPRATKGGLEVGDGFYGVGRAVSIPAGGARARLTFDVTLYADVKAMMRRERFDIVHLHEPLMPVLPYMVLLNSQAVNVATFHAYRTINHWYTVFKPYMSFVLSRLDGRIAVSEPAREFVRQYFDGPYDVIPNGIDTNRYGDHVEPFPWASDGLPRILFVGRFDESRKGFKHLLRALPLVQRRFPNARLVVLGTGKQERFAGCMERYGVRNVDFIGFVDGETKSRYYASCDVCCFPSVRNESFGYVVLEGMASGKPVVATDIPGYASILTHEREGLLVPPEDHQALAQKLVRLLEDEDLRARFGEQGRETAARYDWSVVAQRVLVVYEQATEQARTAPWRRTLV